jgi:hypothetical protein
MVSVEWGGYSVIVVYSWTLGKTTIQLEGVGLVWNRVATQSLLITAEH